MKNNKYKETLKYYQNLSADWFEDNQDEVIALHHKDLELKKKDPKRYNEWRIEDVEPLTRRDHCRLHAKGFPQSKAEYRKRKRHMKESVDKMRSHRDMMIRIQFPDGSVEYAETQQEAADMLGCSRMQVYYTMSNLPQHKYYHTCKKCILKWVTLKDIVEEGKAGAR